jgi:hypothetical protein
MAKFGSGGEEGPSRLWGLIFAGAGIGVFSAFQHFGQSGRGLIATATVIVLLGVGLVKWKLRTKPWFWAVMLFFALIHMAIIFAVPWANEDYPIYVLFPFAIVDGGVLIYLLSHFEHRRDSR